MKAALLCVGLLLATYVSADNHPGTLFFRDQAIPLGHFDGDINIRSFSIGDPITKRLDVIMDLSGCIRGAEHIPVAGRSLAVQNVTMVNRADSNERAVCNILNLVLGPLHLNLLGLVVDLNRVILNITGQTGAGNLLGKSLRYQVNF